MFEGIEDTEDLKTPKRPHMSDSSEDSFSVFAKPPTKKTTTTMADTLVEDDQAEIRTELQKLQVQLGEVNSETAIIKDNMSQLDIMQYLIACVSKQQTQINKLTHEVIDLKGRSMRNNVLVHNVPEGAKGENQELKVREALTQININHEGIEFDRVHRIGEYRASAKRPRPIVAQCITSKMTEKLLKQRPKWEEQESNEPDVNTVNGDGASGVDTNNTKSENTSQEQPQKKDPWITPQYPPETLGENREAKDNAKKYRKAHPEAEVYVKRNKMYINGNIVNPPVVKPQINELLDLHTTKEHNELKQKYKFTPVQDLKVDGVTVRAFRCTKHLTSVDQVRGAYRAFLMDSTRVKAAYNALAYKVGNINGYVDDGSGGMGRTMLKTFTEKRKNRDCGVLFITQYHAKNIGFAKFDTAVKLTKTYLEKFVK